MYLNSGDSFTVITEYAGFVWSGIGSNDVESAAAENLFDFFNLRPQYTAKCKEG